MSISINLAVALVCGMLIGLERHWLQRHTGLTTHALVALGAATFTSLAGLYGGDVDIRMGAQVVSGIGFLGAGLIMRDGLSVRGLRGAATIWATGAVGTLAGYGFLAEAVTATGFVILINMALPRLSRLVERFTPEQELVERFYVIKLRCAAGDEAWTRARMLQAVRVQNLRLHGLESRAMADSGSVEVEAMVYSTKQEDRLVERLVGELSLSPLINATSWTSTAPPE
ncbi:MgtC/SapB family protein [Kaistia adipata]|uniref:MgtC/SapB family protein n=1 Tax=Kaistia adipata TaxID=166954 RepID=UPI00048B8F37|nr:MgtC/SapB family protein [Kaistia adipata]